MFAATRLGTSLGEYYYRYMWVVAEGVGIVFLHRMVVSLVNGEGNFN